VLPWLLGASLAAFVLQKLTLWAGGGRWLVEWLALSAWGIRHGRFWQLVTYQFLHGDLGHLFFNMLGLYLIGRELEEAIGRRHFTVLYFLSGVLGGLGFIWLEPYAPCVGASGAVFGVLAAFAVLFPKCEMVLLIFPFMPLPAWLLVSAYVLLEWLYLVGNLGGGIAHSAHLGGAIAGAVYVQVVFGSIEFGSVRRWMGRMSQFRRTRRSEETVDREEIDRILDKVARQGLQSLTSSERRRLEEASRQLRGWER
jgi:membrane associated rhomboid family serine protease